MDHNGRIIPGHIRENLKRYYPDITTNHILCLDCGYEGRMGFTTKRSWDFGSFFNIIIWGLFAFGFLLTLATGGGFLALIALVVCVYWCLKNIGGNISTIMHCPNCRVVWVTSEKANRTF